eukprot:m51a1_g14569 hypothetical protein (280) ;mRNA; f:1065787-1067002
MAQLPLPLRKAIRDAEAKKGEYITAIEEAFGISGVTFECDYAAVHAALDAGSKEQVPNVIDAYLSNFAGSVRRLLEDSLTKEWWVRDWTSKKIVFRVAPKPFEGYCRQVIEGGVLYWEVKPNTFYTNVDELISRAPAGLHGNLELAKNLRDYEEKKNENLRTIAGALGVDSVSFEADIDKVNAAAKDRGYENRTGEILFDWYLGGLASNLQRMCGDDMTKEAIRDAVSAKKIIFRINAKPKGGSYTYDYFENGNLIVEVKPDNLASNVGECGAELEKLL